jgi:hypothetical protein
VPRPLAPYEVAVLRLAPGPESLESAA